MVEPLTAHPAADRVTAEALVVEQFRNVVPASTWLVDAAKAAAGGAGKSATAGGAGKSATAGSTRVLQLLTSEHSRITYPLELLLRDAAAEWVVREDTGRYRDGIHGYAMAWNGARFAPDLDAATATPVDPTPGSGDIEVQIATLYPATEKLQLGTSTEAAIRALTGERPTGWGIAEPATQPWSAREITAHCRDRAPKATKLIVVGSGVVGQLQVSRVDTGVLEEIRLSGPAAGEVHQDSIEALAEEIAGTARLMVVAAHPGRRNGLRSSAPTLPALPYGMLIGHEMVAVGGLDHAKRTPATRVRILGSGRRNAAWCRLDQGQKAPFEQLTDILRHFGLPDQN
jgi:hypothetical protein